MSQSVWNGDVCGRGLGCEYAPSDVGSLLAIGHDDLVGCRKEDRAVSGGVAVREDHVVGRFLDKNQRDALDASLGQMDVTEELRVCGIASISGARGADSTDTYYLITNQGTYFARARKTGFMKKEVSPEFVAHADITHSDYINDAAVILRCYRGGGDHFLAFSFYLSASHGGEQAELAKVASAMGRAPVDVTYEVIPAARYR